MARLQFLMFSLHSGSGRSFALLPCCVAGEEVSPLQRAIQHAAHLQPNVTNWDMDKTKVTKRATKVCHKSQRSHFQDGLDKLCQSVAKVRWSDDHSDIQKAIELFKQDIGDFDNNLSVLAFFDLGRSLHSNSDMFRKHLWSFCQMWTSAWRTQALARVSAPCVGGKKVEVQLGSFGLSLLSPGVPGSY